MTSSFHNNPRRAITKINLIRKQQAGPVTCHKQISTFPDPSTPNPRPNCLLSYSCHPSGNLFTYHSISMGLDQIPNQISAPANGTARFYIRLGGFRKIEGTHTVESKFFLLIILPYRQLLRTQMRKCSYQRGRVHGDQTNSFRSEHSILSYPTVLLTQHGSTPVS